MSSPRIAAAVASIGGPRDLQLRTTLRRDDVDVRTSWLPVAGVYETTLTAPDDVLVRMAELDVQTLDREQAIRNHASMCHAVEAVLRGQVTR